MLAAVSGGPDSTALLVALHEAGFDVVAAHYDHSLREGSDEVAALVDRFCAARGIPLITERRSEPLPKGSTQAAARALRYAFLDRARRQAGADVVATAHTADDLVEGVVLHLLRGCGLAGFRGMPVRRGSYVRPWLGVWRAEVEEFLARRGIAAHQDPANRDPRYARVRVRTRVLPALERDRPGIVRRFHAAARAVSALHDTATAQAAEAITGGPVTAAALLSMPEAVAIEVLKQLYASAGGKEPGLARSHLRAMLELTRGQGRGGRGVDLPGALRFRIVGGRLEVISSTSGVTEKARLEVRPCSGCDDAGAAHLRAGLSLRLGYRTPGLRIRPAGGNGTRKLQDIFVDARVPREDRDRWPLVFAGDRLAWIPGLGVAEDLISPVGEPALHVAISQIARPTREKVVRLDRPIRPPGDQI
ncbi:MAG TPA: tRNA lysidine(34) synthetase TilS [Candidatus Dormibacteraeota bacterium]|nr:tRNA lysidine(34) synthetase TilS [Candidatus Dormibacteraeota bacterium]